MNFRFFLTFFLIVIFCNGQDRLYNYELKYKISEADDSIVDDLVLVLKKDASVFLSKKFIEIDSINFYNSNKNQKQYISTRYNTIVVNNLIESKTQFYKRLDMDYFTYDRSIVLDWKLHQEYDSIGKYPVQKATVSYGGRQWVAWFSKDINLPYGPHIFHGLPGLIIRIYDEKNNFNFSLVDGGKLAPHDIDVIGLFENTPKRITREQWKDVQIIFFNNPLFNYKTVGWVMYNKDGSKFSNEDYRRMENRIQEEMIRYNNPLELDEKVELKKFN